MLDEQRSSADIAADEEFIGAQIRTWRTAANMTLSDLARESDLSIGYISQVERGRANPSISSLKQLVDALGKTVADLFLEDGREAAAVHISRRGNSPRLHYGEGLANELLSPRSNAAMEVIWVEAEVGTSSGHKHHTHQGEEFGFIIQGSMRIEVEGDHYSLEPGDGIYFRSSAPHQWTSEGPDDLRALWVITPPTF